MVKKLAEVFDTAEGWAFGIGFLWGLLCNFVPAFPTSLNIPGIPGGITPALFVVFGLPVILAKFGRTGVTPFQPIKTAAEGAPSGSPTPGTSSLVILVLGASLALSLAAGTAFAQEEEPLPVKAWSVDRIGYLLDGGVAARDETHATAVGQRVNGYGHLGLFYSMGPKFTLGLADCWHFGANYGELEGGIRWNVSGGKPSDTMRLGIGVNAVRYHGGNDDIMAEDFSWNAGAYGSQRVTGELYLRISAEYDLRNSYTAARAGLGFSGLVFD